MTQIPEITPEELVAAIETGEPFQVLDVRAPQMVAGGRIDIVPRERFANLPGSRIQAAGGIDECGFDRQRPLAVVCAMGVSSRGVTQFLRAQGWQASSLRGGMAGWLHTLVPRELAPPAGFDRLVQLDRVAKGALGYLLVRGAAALAVDPPRRWERFAELAAERGARLVAVADTHAHADYVSGARDLARRCGVSYHLHADDAVVPWDGTRGRLEFVDLASRPEIPLADAVVRAEPTPGHTAGSVTLRAGAGAALTGDFVFVRSLGRPDLGGRAAEWTGLLWRSLERARASWADDLEILPAHYASAAERRADGAVAASWGAVRRDNEPLGLETEEALRRWVEERSTPLPGAYRDIKRVNVGVLAVDDGAADVLEAGRNQCAVGGPPRG
jgi:glyoxylase-like metal-dependent hydrolase (beta-lactamase superfamily II)